MKRWTRFVPVGLVPVGQEEDDMARTVIDSLTDVPELLRGEYEARDGKFVLKLEGDQHPAVREVNTRLAEFRDNNISLLKFKETAEVKLKEYEGFDPKEFGRLKSEIETLRKNQGKPPEDVQAQIQKAVSDAIEPLRREVSSETEKREAAERKLAQRDLESKLREVGGRLKVMETAIPDFLSRGLRVFGLDGVAREGEKPLYSKDKPTEALSMDEWGKIQMQDAPHLFTPSKGGGAHPAAGAGGKRVLETSDPLELGRNLEAIAKGDMIVRPPSS